MGALRWIHSYLSERNEAEGKDKWAVQFMERKPYLCPARLSLGVLLFDIYLYYLFLFMQDDVKNADDTTIYASNSSIESVIKHLRAVPLELSAK